MSEDSTHRYKSSRSDFSAKESDVISLRNGSAKPSPVSLKRKHEGRSERSSDSRSSSYKSSSSYSSSRSRFSDDSSKSSSRGEEKSSRFSENKPRFSEEKSSKSNRSSEEKTSRFSDKESSRNSSERTSRFSEEKSSRSSAERTSRFSDNSAASVPMPEEPAPVEPKAPSPPPTIMTLSKPPKKSKLTVASAFNVSEDESEEEMPLHARMKMRNMGKDTPTSSGPNSFGKTAKGFTDTVKLWDKDPVKVAQILAEKAEKEKSG